MIRPIIHSIYTCIPKCNVVGFISKRIVTRIPPPKSPISGRQESSSLTFDQQDKVQRLWALLLSGLEPNPGVIVATDIPIISKTGYTVLIESQQCGAEQFCSIAKEEGLQLELFTPGSSLIAIPLHTNDEEERVRQIVEVLKRTTDRIGERF